MSPPKRRCPAAGISLGSPSLGTTQSFLPLPVQRAGPDPAGSARDSAGQGITHSAAYTPALFSRNEFTCIPVLYFNTVHPVPVLTNRPAVLYEPHPAPRWTHTQRGKEEKCPRTRETSLMVSKDEFFLSHLFFKRKAFQSTEPGPLH